MTDDPNLEDEVADEGALEHDEGGYEDFGAAADPAAILAEASLERMHRQAYWHHNSKQLFSFLFANCFFFAGTLAVWNRAVPGEAGDPSLYINGLDTIRGSVIFALSLYGFWTAVFNLWHGQMKVWPYLLNAVLALWIGIGGIAAGVGGERWDAAKAWLGEQTSKKLLDDITVPISVIAPGFWLLSIGGLIVVWVIIQGLLKGQQSVKASGASESGGSSRRRR